ncbi:MAG: 30S ribosomal protein S2 [Acidobacteria bacterium]|nr:30S ribosomal protein S2 [Acidobacteriota bacterium]
MISVSLRDLLEAGVHFGHQTGRWNPKMRQFIFGKRNGIYIIDLQQTRARWNEALEFLEQEAAQGGKILFVGTKRQAQNIVAEEANRCGQYYVNHRWLGGLLTNYQTISKSIDRYKDLEAMAEDGRSSLLTKKEVLRLDRERFKLERNLIGIRDMGGLPDVVFVLDIRRERIAVDEALKLGIPVVSIVDTNCDPDGIDYVIPGNDDAIRSIRLFCSAAADAVLSGAATYDAMVEEKALAVAAAKQEAEAQKEAANEKKAGSKKAKKAKPAPEPEPAPVEAAPAESAEEPDAESATDEDTASDDAGSDEKAEAGEEETKDAE